MHTTTAKIERMKTQLEQGHWISPSTKTSSPCKKISRSQQLAIVLDVCNGPRPKKAQVDSTSPTVTLDLEMDALIFFQPLQCPLNPFATTTSSTPNPLHGSTHVPSVATIPSSTVNLEHSLPERIVLQICTSTSDVSTTDPGSDSVASDSNVDILVVDLVALVDEGLDATTTSKLDAIVGDIANGK